jgi:hypothetical protein
MDPQPGGDAVLDYLYRYLAPVNMGIRNGLDLNRTGALGDPDNDPADGSGDHSAIVEWL